MPTLNAVRVVHIEGTSDSDFSTARTSNSGTVTIISGGSQYVQFYTGRGKHRFSRVFTYFDTSGVTGTVSAAHIDVDGGGTSPDPNDTIIIKSTAFGGDGSGGVTTSDMYSSLVYGTPYSTELTSWNTSTNNEYTLNANALTDIKDEDVLIIAIIDHDADYANTDTGSTSDIIIDFDTTITLDYTLAPTGYGNAVNGVPSANIGKVIDVATANIEKIIGVD
jgi:hypothetical protein